MPVDLRTALEPDQAHMAFDPKRPKVGLVGQPELFGQPRLSQPIKEMFFVLCRLECHDHPICGNRIIWSESQYLGCLRPSLVKLSQLCVGSGQPHMPAS